MSIEPHLNAGNALFFGHGLNIRYGQIKPPAGVDVGMVAPKGPGHLVRSQYEGAAACPCIAAVEQDATGKGLAWPCPTPRASAAPGPASSRPPSPRRPRPTSSASRRCSAAARVLVKAGFETLVEAGYQPESAYFECLHELKLIVDLMYEGGLEKMRWSVSETAEWGDYVTGPRIINDEPGPR